MLHCNRVNYLVESYLRWYTYGPLNCFAYGEIIKSFGGPRYLFTIPLKNFHLFKIAKSVINLCLKKFSN